MMWGRQIVGAWIFFASIGWSSYSGIMFEFRDRR